MGAVLKAQNHPSRGVRSKIHISLFDPNKTLNGRPVEHDFVIEGFRKLANGNFHRFDGSENVRELQTNVLDVFGFCHV